MVIAKSERGGLGESSFGTRGTHPRVFFLGFFSNLRREHRGTSCPASRQLDGQRRLAATAVTEEMAFYEALSVSPTADSAVLRRAFKRKALLCHPDKSDEPDAEEQFKRLERAWRVLSDPASREAYDARLRVGIDDGADEEPPCGHSEDDEDAYWRAEAAAARRSYEAAMAEAMEEMEEVSEEEAARRRHRERMFLCSVLTFLLLSACTFALLWKALSRQGALFPSPLTLTNRQFGDLSIRDDFRRVTGALVGSHVSRQPWPSRLAAALLRTHTPYLRLRHNATDVRPLQPVQAASLGCPTPAALLATPRRVGDRVLQIHTFVQVPRPPPCSLLPAAAVQVPRPAPTLAPSPTHRSHRSRARLRPTAAGRRTDDAPPPPPSAGRHDGPVTYRHLPSPTVTYRHLPSPTVT